MTFAFDTDSNSDNENDEVDEEEVAVAPPPTTISTASTSTSTSTTALSSDPMGVDGNGTGALLKRSHTSGGKDGSLMVTSNKRLAYPIDSGKDGMEANDTKRKTQSSSSSNSKALQFQQQTGPSLVRHDLSPPSSSSS